MLLTMSWTELHRYILSVAPQLADKLVGVPEQDIAACEQGWNLRLPSAYREFLLTMGVDAGGFYPLGLTEWNFYEVLSDLPDDYDPRDLFRIATETANGLTCYNDLYLDMRTIGPEGDCDVLVIEYALPPRREDAFGQRQTFCEIVTEMAWTQLDAKRFAHSRIVMTSARTPEDGVARSLDLVELLGRMGFVNALPSLPRVDCLWLDGGRTGTARVVRTEHGLRCVVASDSEATVKRLAEQLLDNVPDTHVNPRFPSLESLG